MSTNKEIKQLPTASGMLGTSPSQRKGSAFGTVAFFIGLMPRHEALETDAICVPSTFPGIYNFTITRHS